MGLIVTTTAQPEDIASAFANDPAMLVATLAILHDLNGQEGGMLTMMAGEAAYPDGTEDIRLADAKAAATFAADLSRELMRHAGVK